MSMFVLRPRPKANVIPIRPGIQVPNQELSPEENAARLRREERVHAIAFVIGSSVMFALASLLVWLVRLAEWRGR